MWSVVAQNTERRDEAEIFLLRQHEHLIGGILDDAIDLIVQIALDGEELVHEFHQRTFLCVIFMQRFPLGLF